MRIIPFLCLLLPLTLQSLPVFTTNAPLPDSEEELIHLYHDSHGNPIPIVFKSAALHWPAINWSPVFLSQEFGQLPFNPQSPRTQKFPNFQAFFETITQDPFPHDPANYYYGETSAYPTHRQPILSELNLPTATSFPSFHKKILKQHSPRYLLLIGPKGTHTPNHNHQQAFIAQLHGEKFVIFFPPEFNTACFYHTLHSPRFLRKFLFNLHNLYTKPFCQSNLLEPSFFTLNPEFQSLPIYQAILQPGDVLYIPDAWLHDVTSLSPSVSLGFGF